LLTIALLQTFLKSLDVPWPAAFGSIMSRVNVINLNLVQLPKAACMNPTVDYYKSFNGAFSFWVSRPACAC
jgi:hypothetical protein